MTLSIKHQYDELLPAALQGLEIHVEYFCESEIEIGEDGEEEVNRLLTIAPRVNGAASHFSAFPTEKTDAKFLGLLRENARQALWAKALEAAKEAGYTHPQEISAAAEMWQRTGKAKL